MQSLKYGVCFPLIAHFNLYCPQLKYSVARFQFPLLYKGDVNASLYHCEDEMRLYIRMPETL